jgi:hypothetical protein
LDETGGFARFCPLLFDGGEASKWLQPFALVAGPNLCLWTQHTLESHPQRFNVLQRVVKALGSTPVLSAAVLSAGQQTELLRMLSHTGRHITFDRVQFSEVRVYHTSVLFHGRSFAASEPADFVQQQGRDCLLELF